MYFSYSETMARFQVDEIMQLVTVFLEECSEAVEYIKNLMDILCLRSKIICLITFMKKHMR